jgi:alanine transaminase
MKQSTQLFNRIIKVAELNPNLLKAQYAVRGAVMIKADKYNKMLKNPNHGLPFNDIIYCNIGNPQQLQQKPMTFNRNVVSLVYSPELLNNPTITSQFPSDVVQRAQTILDGIKENTGSYWGSGAYTHSQGLYYVRKNVADFIERRDGVKSNPDRIFLTDGASPGVQSILRMLIGGKQDGIMIPIPQYPLYSASIDLYGGSQIHYMCTEGKGHKWTTSIESLEKAYEKAKRDGIKPRALVIINPGNPTGTVLPKEDMKAIVDFCVRRRVCLLADEVYQENIYGDNPFISFKKIVDEMGLTDTFELFSFHTCSKGFLGECGRRGGYYEISPGVATEVIEQLYKAASINLCPNIDGQLTCDLMVNPPKKGDESYEQYQKEKNAILSSMKRRAIKLVEAFNKLPNIECGPSEGAMYAFPQIFLPEKAVAEAKKQNMQPDLFYVLSMLDKTGVCTVPGSGFGQEPGTYHFRTTFLPPESKMEEMAERFKKFHIEFMEKYK